MTEPPEPASPQRHRRESIVFEPELAEGSLLVQGYGPGVIRVGGQAFQHPILVMARAVLEIEAAALADMSQSRPEAWFPEGEIPEILFLGTGARMALPPAALRERCQALGLALEPMDTGAAARTYNVLLIEGRRVAALLFPLAD